MASELTPAQQQQVFALLYGELRRAHEAEPDLEPAGGSSPVPIEPAGDHQPAPAEDRLPAPGQSAGDPPTR